MGSAQSKKVQGDEGQDRPVAKADVNRAGYRESAALAQVSHAAQA